MEFSLLEDPRHDYMINLNFNEIYKFSGLGYKTINIVKRYIIPQYNLYNGLLNIKIPKEYYKIWWKNYEFG